MSPGAIGRLPPRIAVGIGLGVVVVAGVVAGQAGGFGLGRAQAMAESLTDAARDLGPLGWLILVLAQVGVAMAGIVPASLLGVAAGATYGIALGFVLSAAGTLIGGWLAFLLARSLLRDWIVARIARWPTGPRLDEAIGRDGWRLVCLLRVSPVMPFAVTSYALGLTGISLPAYLLGTLAALPALLGFVAIGALARLSLNGPSGAAGLLRVSLLLLGVGATLLLILRVGRVLRGVKGRGVLF